MTENILVLEKHWIGNLILHQKNKKINKQTQKTKPEKEQKTPEINRKK